MNSRNDEIRCQPGELVASHTEQCIQALANAFAKGACPRDLCIESLQSLVRLAISEHEARPVIAAAADLRRIEEIRRASKQAN